MYASARIEDYSSNLPTSCARLLNRCLALRRPREAWCDSGGVLSSLQGIFLARKQYKSLMHIIPIRSTSTSAILIGQIAESFLHIRVQLLNCLGDCILSLVGVLKGKA